MKSRTIRTQSEEETIALGESLAAELPAKVTVLLIGNLGTGKTTLAEQVATIGLDEIFEREAVVLVEWGERFPELMPEERVEITLRAVGGDEREISISSRMHTDEHG